MDFMVNIDLKKLPEPITYKDNIFLIGSCFTEHIGNALGSAKFSILQNPNGILFDPASVCKSLISYIENKKYNKTDLFYLNEVWNSWHHHSRFSNINEEKAIRIINESQQKAHDLLKKTNWLIITLGSSFSYRLTSLNQSSAGIVNEGVANCHRAPTQWFDKHMLTIEETNGMIDNCCHRLRQFNPDINIIFTVSPVRHLRDGVVENNRSKARLIESVHHFVNKFDKVYYFPAYELVIDVLRDYRFYDIDLAHPNYSATEFVLEKFTDTCIDESSQNLMQEMRKIAIAKKHKPFQPDTNVHKQFLKSQYEKVKLLKEKHPFLDLQEELDYFSRH